MILPSAVRSGSIACFVRESGVGLRAAVMEAERADHLVVDDEGARLASHLAKPLKVTGLRHDHAEVADDRLDHDCGYVVAPTLKRLLAGRAVVERHSDDFACDARRHAGAVRNAERRRPGAGRDQYEIRVAVVAAGELDDFAALRVGAGHANRRHHGFRAGVDERTLSSEGIASFSMRASLISSSVGVPYSVPFSAADAIASVICGWA